MGKNRLPVLFYGDLVLESLRNSYGLKQEPRHHNRPLKLKSWTTPALLLL
jgi:hypothetical protein